MAAPTPVSEEDDHTECGNTPSLTIGGTKGHLLEEVSGAFLVLFQRYRWKPIPRCTGRYTCRDHETTAVSPRQLLASAKVRFQEIHKLDLDDREDDLIVVAFDEAETTGLITYVKHPAEGLQYVHTLNAPSGFQRKLAAIGITLHGGARLKRKTVHR